MVYEKYASYETMVHSETLFQDSNIFKNDLGRLSLLNNKDWSLFIKEKSQTSYLGVRPVELRVNRLTSR